MIQFLRCVSLCLIYKYFNILLLKRGKNDLIPLDLEVFSPGYYNKKNMKINSQNNPQLWKTPNFKFTRAGTKSKPPFFVEKNPSPPPTVLLYIILINNIII